MTLGGNNVYNMGARHDVLETAQNGRAMTCQLWLIKEQSASVHFMCIWR